MKITEWLLSVLIIFIGVHCLVMSGMITSSTKSYFSLTIQICMVIGIPLLVGALIYIIIKKINSKKMM